MATVPPMQDGCPWSELSHWAAPNVKWCEAQTCSWVVEPANTWSNLAYVAIGLALLVRAKRSGEKLDSAFGWAQMAVGVFSFVYHASYTFVLQVFDFAAMYLFLMLLVTFNLVRLGTVARERLWSTYFATVLVLTAVTPVIAQTKFPIQAIVGGLVVTLLATEGLLYARGARAVSYRWFWTSLALIAGAATCSALDVTRVWCDPENHFLQGHATWHVLSALSLGASWMYYRQFAPDLTSASTSVALA